MLEADRKWFSLTKLADRRLVTTLTATNGAFSFSLPYAGARLYLVACGESKVTVIDRNNTTISGTPVAVENPSPGVTNVITVPDDFVPCRQVK